MMLQYEFMLVSSLEKVFPKSTPKNRISSVVSGLVGETISFQLAYKLEAEVNELTNHEISVSLDTKLKDGIQIRSVELVPSELPSYGLKDDNYITTDPGLFPDLLLPKQNLTLKPFPGQWRAVWFDITLTKELGTEVYPVIIKIEKDKKIIWEDSFAIQTLNIELPPQELIHTQWFHADCLAQYYNVPVFSEQHWTIIESFIETAVKHGMNMLLTPIFTPPLDTKEGGERTTVQLVQIKNEGEYYTFDFELLKRWISICKTKGMKYIEICHLFTQWGAKHAPKIMAEVYGQLERIFGWDTDATGKEYSDFLHQFIPELKRVLTAEGVLDHTYFHISDEPHDYQKETYAAAKEVVKDLLQGCKVIDALSSFGLYKEGVVEKPIPCNDHIQPFIDAGIPNLWTYYCCVQTVDVSNRFFSMPSARNRILGIQLYLYNIEGFLHWGYNFYNTQHSVAAIDPYRVTDAGGAFPSGDPFIVYPAEDGTAYESIRLMVLSEALYDLRALKLLERLTGRAYVESLIYEEYSEKITFKQYPKNPEYLLKLREKVNQEILRHYKMI
jgi:hypothetical protein